MHLRLVPNRMRLFAFPGGMPEDLAETDPLYDALHVIKMWSICDCGSALLHGRAAAAGNNRCYCTKPQQLGNNTCHCREQQMLPVVLEWLCKLFG